MRPISDEDMQPGTIVSMPRPVITGPTEAGRYKHALEVIRDAEHLDADALRTIAYAVVGPSMRLMTPIHEA